MPNCFPFPPCTEYGPGSISPCPNWPPQPPCFIPLIQAVCSGGCTTTGCGSSGCVSGQTANNVPSPGGCQSCGGAAASTAAACCYIPNAADYNGMPIICPASNIP